MTIAVPNLFRAGDVLDPRRLNENFQEIAEKCGDVRDRRFTYWTEVHRIDGLSDTDGEGYREVVLVTSSSRTATVVGVRLAVAAAADATWTLTMPDSTTVAVTTTSTTVYATADRTGGPVSINSSAQYAVLTADVASTITSGYVEILCRSDRLAQGQSLAPYEPTTTFSAVDTPDPALLNAEFSAIATFASADAARTRDVYCDRIRIPQSAISCVIPVPAVGKNLIGLGVHVAASAVSTTVRLDDETATIVATLTVGASASGTYGFTARSDTQVGTDPSVTADDWTLTVTPGTSAAVTILLFWE